MSDEWDVDVSFIAYKSMACVWSQGSNMCGGSLIFYK